MEGRSSRLCRCVLSWTRPVVQSKTIPSPTWQQICLQLHSCTLHPPLQVLYRAFEAVSILRSCFIAQMQTIHRLKKFSSGRDQSQAAPCSTFSFVLHGIEDTCYRLKASQIRSEQSISMLTLLHLFHFSPPFSPLLSHLTRHPSKTNSLADNSLGESDARRAFRGALRRGGGSSNPLLLVGGFDDCRRTCASA